jgi:hypothetical protein
MESHYSLNIAIVTERRAWAWKKDAPRFETTHYARVNLGTDHDAAKRKAAEFAERFPEGDKPGNFRLRLTHWSCTGREVEFRPASPVGAEAAAMAAAATDPETTGEFDAVDFANGGDGKVYE